MHGAHRPRGDDGAAVLTRHELETLLSGMGDSSADVVPVGGSGGVARARALAAPPANASSSASAALPALIFLSGVRGWGAVRALWLAA